VADETWIQEGDPRNACSRLQKAACRSAGFEPKVGFQSDDYNVVQGLVASGMGVSLLPSLALANMREDVVVRSLGSRAPARKIAAATLAGRYRSPATAAMLAILEEVAAGFELPSGTAVAAA
jgi:DNA-binding transcriptional LysR family regulator